MFSKPPAPDETTNQPTETKSTLGTFFQAARQAQGLDLGAVASDLKITPANLTALEDDNRAALPPDIFTRGYVRLYASYLKLDPQEAIERYQRQWQAEDKAINSLHGQPDQRPSSVATPLVWGAMLVTLLLALFFVVRLLCPAGTDQPPPAIAPPIVNQEDSKPVEPNQADTPPSPASEAGQAQAVGSALPPTGITETTQPTEATTAPVPQVPPYELRLQSSQKTKVKLAIDGKRALEKNIRPGSTQSWRAEKAFELTVDGTAGIGLTINGATIPIPPEAGQTTIHRP